MGLTHKHKHTHRNIALTQGICESHPRLLTLSNSHKCSKQHKITQQIHTPQGYFLTQHPHMVTEYHTHTHTHKAHTLGLRQRHPHFTPNTNSQTRSPQHTATQETHTNSGGLFLTLMHKVPQRHSTHTHTHTNTALAQSLWQRHPH